MSWALEEWKEGLSTRALQKIQELEGQLDKLKKERQQRQFQLESLEAALQKQKQKAEDQKNEGASLKRENQSLMETCDNLVKMKQKISHELQVKESQVNFQEGQLNSSKKQIEKLEQELKRCKSELERSQLAVLPDVSALNSTPQKNCATPIQSSHQSGSKNKELQEKYNKEVEKRKKLEEELKALQMKKASKPVPPSTLSHREIARHQASSSVFSWQQEKTPTRHSSSAQETPLKRSFTALQIPWEQETPPNRKSSWQTERKDASCSLHENQSNLNLLDQLKAQNQELKCKVNELDRQLQAQEHDIKGYMNKLQETQFQLEKTKLELTEKDKVLNKTGDELMRLTSQLDRVTAKYTKLEQKLKKMSEDLNCQRQNAESTRCSLEQKIKDKDKDYQEELSHQQRTLQMLDQENTQIKAKLNQELQQARSTQNILQAELDKVVVMKQQLEKNSDEFKQKLCRTEQALQTSQTKETELRRSVEEMMQEKQLFSHQLDEKTREVNQMEEELKKTKLCLKQSQNLAEEMKDKNATQEDVLKALQEKISQQEKSSMLELAVADLEKQRDCSQDLLKKREHHIEQLNDKLHSTQRELEELRSTLGLKEKECEELKKETILFSQWKNEKEQLLNQLLLEKEGLQSTISNLEICLKTQHVKSHDANESFKIMETEKEKLGLEIRNLQNAIEGKNTELEAQKQAYEELQKKAEYSDQKYKKEVENLSLKIVQLTTEVEHLKQKLQLLSSEIIGKDQRYEELHIQYEKISSLVKSENSSQMMNEDYCGRDLLILEQPILSNSISNILEIQGSLPLEQGSKRTKLYSEDPSMENAAKLQHKVSSFEFSADSQNQMNADLQRHCEELVQIKGELEENLIKAEHTHISFMAETNLCINKLQESNSHHKVFEETLIALENKDKQLQKLNEQLEYGQAEINDLTTKNQLLKESVKKLQLLSETLSSEKEEINSVLFQNKKEIEELIQENGNLKEINAILNTEKMNLIQKNVSFSNCFIEREKNISELSDRSKEEELLVKRCEEAEKGLEVLKEKYKLMEEKNIELEYILKEHTTTSLCGKGNNELKELEEAFAREYKDYLSKLALAEEKNEKLTSEMETMQCRLRAEVVAIQNTSKIEADGLRQEISNFKDEQTKMQEQHHFLLQENDRLMKLVKAKNVQMNELVLTSSPASKQISKSVNELDNLEVTQIEMFHLNLEAKDSFLNTHNAQVVPLEQVIEHMELRLKESEKEKEVLKQELEMIKKELEIRDSEAMEAKQSDQSFETSNYEDCKREMDEKYISVLHELSTSQNDNAQLMTSLQTTVNKLNELEKMCEILQTEKLELTSELNDSKSECILATTKMAEKVEKLVNEVKTLNNKNSDLSGELMKENSKDEFGEQFDQPKSICLELIEGRIEGGDDYEHLKLSNKEVQMHFIELQEKISSLQIEHRILHEQHCHMSSKLSELRSYTDTLKAENSVLSVNLKNMQSDLIKQLTPDKEEFVVEEGESLSSCMNEIANLTSFVESSFYKDLFEEGREIPPLNSLEETILDNQSSANIDEGPCSSLEADNRTKKITRFGPSLNIEEFETLCQSYQISIKNLEDKYENQKIMKDKEIQELKELVCSERSELEFLRKQYLSENEQWQEKLANVTVEMESKLAAEKKQTEYLSLQLEVARLQLQDLELSSRSFLIAEGEDVSMLKNNILDKAEEHVSFIHEKIIKSDRLQIYNKNVQETFNLECEEIAEIEGISSVAVYSREANLENEQRSSSDKTHSECIPELSFSSNDTLAAMDFLENQVLIQNLQFKVKEISNENLKLIQGIEESDKKVDKLLSEIKELDYKVDLQKAELTAKICMCSELEKVIQELQKEKSDLNEKLGFLSYDNQQLLQRVTSLENLNSGLEMCKVISTDTKDVEDDVAMVNKSWKEQFLEIENEFKKVKSEKNNIENHAFSLEADLESLQTKNLCLEKDNENKHKMISNLEEQLSLVISERNQLNGELDILLKAKLKIEEICDELKERIKVLESNQRESLQHIQVVESEVRDKKQLLQTMSSDVNQILKDKDYLQEQLQNLEQDNQMLSLLKDGLKNEISQLTDEKELFRRESENLQAKLNDVEAENVNLSRALEGSLIEKGEIAARLNSTQEEVHQLKNGIEKLKVRIEADEKKKHHVLEKLKESERKADSFKDKIEALERELLMSEENQEAIILDAENAKFELETLKTQMEELTKGLKSSELELSALRSEKNRTEKENILKELQEKQGQVSELEQLAHTLSYLKSELVALKSEKEIVLEELQEKENRVSELEELIQNLSYGETGVVTVISEKANMLKNLQETQNQTSELEEWTQTPKCLESVTLRSEKENMLNELQEKQAKVSELEALNQTLKHLETELIAVKLVKENLSKELLQEKQSKVLELEKLSTNLKLSDTEILALRSEKENALKELHENQSKVSEFLKYVESIVSLKSEKENMSIELQENHNYLLEELTKTLKSLEMEVVILRAEKENMSKNQQENQVSEVEELTQTMKYLESELVALRTEKETISNELLKEKQSRVYELEKLTHSLQFLETEVASLRSEKETISEELYKKQGQMSELEELIENLKCVETEVVALRSEKENVLKELKGKQYHVCQLEESIQILKCLEKEVIVLRSEKENILRELQKNNYQIFELGELVEMLKCLDSELITIRLEKENVLKDLQDKQNQVSELEELIKSLKCLETELVSLRCEKENMSKELKEKQRQVSELEELVMSLKYLETEVTSITSEKENMLKDLQEEKQAQKYELEELSINLKCLETELVSLRSEKDNMSKELQEKLAQVSELEELTKSLKSLELEVASLKSEKENMLKDLQEKQAQKCELEELTINLQYLESEVAALRSEKENMLKDLREQQDQICELREMNTNLKCLETEVISLRLAKENMSKELQEKEGQLSELEELTKNLKSLETKFTSLTSEKENLLKQLCELEESTKNLKCLETEVISLRSEKENMSKELQERQSQTSELEELSRNLKSLETECASLTSEKENMLKQLCESEELTKNLKCLETELVSLSSEKQNVLKELQEKQAQVAELEMLNASFESLLEKKEEEKRKLKEESQHATELLQKQLNDLNEKIESFQEEHNIRKAREQDLNCQVDCLKHEKVHLLQQLEETKNNNAMLKSSMNDFIQEIESNKQKLEKTTEENGILQKQVQDLRKLTSVLTQMEAEQQLWKKEKSQLENLTVELQQKIQELSKNETLYNSLEALQNSYANLENELQLTKKENSSLLEKITKVTDNEALLQREKNEMMQKMAVLQEEYNGEKNRFTDYIKIKEAEKSKIHLDKLILEMCELKKSLDYVEKELKEREEKARYEISDYQCRHQDANKNYETLLKKANKGSWHEVEIEAYQEKLACKEQQLSSHKSEMEILKSNKEELTNSLNCTSKILEDLKKTKVENMKYVTQLKKENENARGKIQLLIKTCKQLENEKEALQKEINDLEALQENQKQNSATGVNVEELMAEVKELKEAIEGKNKETDEYLDKYCNLLVSYEKLEKAKNMLESQVTLLSSLQGKIASQSSPMLNSVDSMHCPSQSVTEKKTASHGKVPSKRPSSRIAKESDGDALPSTPETFTKKIKKEVTPKGIPYSLRGLENTQYEPEGLPEVVKKGFADIPTGNTSPYVLRRTTMATKTRTSPRLAAQKLSTPDLQKKQSKNLVETFKPAAGGSKSQMAKDVHQHKVESVVTGAETSPRSPLSTNNLSKKPLDDAAKENMRTKRVKHSKEVSCKVQ
ncbi:centromere protein F [Gracilinanus agilis]|uniref:centromere protein F n=1 Tax=Gracilinanus agilis TaxID=191870 RepID=UPI001CFE80C5|nr:centromere protein F [Gracilinanus agilis]